MVCMIVMRMVFNKVVCNVDGCVICFYFIILLRCVEKSDQDVCVNKSK